MEHCKKLTSWDIYGVRKFPYPGKRKYVPGVNRSFYGTITITNDVFGMTIYQFEREFKACLQRRKEHKQQVLNIRFPDKASNIYLDYLKYGDETVQDQTVPEEYRTYHKLIQLAGTELDIRTRQRMFIVLDKLRNKISNNSREIFISSGSFAEGIYLNGSDFDVMYELTEIKVITDLKYLNTTTSMGQTTLLMDNDDRYPGFCKLKLLVEDNIVSKFIRNCFKDNREGVYLSTETFINNWTKICASTKSFSRHGPCLTDTDQSVDIAHCLRSQLWPKNAMNWIYRQRVGQWPTKHLINIVVNDGCLFVPIGPKDICSELFWRISFSLAEKRLCHSMNYTQLLCYVLLKLSLKDVIESKQEAKDLLCSYFLKTTLFWLSEEIHIDTFKITNLSYCFFLCIEKLISFVKNRFLPNYFIPQQNMLFGRVNGSKNKLLLDILSELRKTELRLIIGKISGCQISYHSVCDLNGKNKLSLHFEQIFFKWFNAIHYRISSWENGHSELQFLKSIMKEESSEFILDMLKYHSAKINQQMSQSIRLPCECNNRNRQCISRASCSNMLIDGTTTDAVSGWLLFASFYYVIGQYKESLQIVDTVLSRCTADMIHFCLAANSEDYKPKTKNNLSLNQRLLKDIFDDVYFLRGSQLMPKELKLEIQDNDMNVPPVVMCYCIRFLCYHHLDHIKDKRRALRQLYQTTINAFLIPEHLMPNALVILGVCYEIDGDKDTAYACYAEAMCTNHSQREMCPSAKQRLEKTSANEYQDLEIKETTDTPTSASYLDLNLYIDNSGHLKSKLYDKRDDFDFLIVNFPFLSSNIPSSPAYGVYISQLIRSLLSCMQSVQ